MENIKKFEPVIFWHQGIMKKGRLLDVALKENGLTIYVEDLQSHEMFTLTPEQVTKE